MLFFSLHSRLALDRGELAANGPAGYAFQDQRNFAEKFADYFVYGSKSANMVSRHAFSRHSSPYLILRV